MEHSKLSDHKFNKGKFTTPLNEFATFFKGNESWSYGRLPEYLWIGLILTKYGRDDGLKQIYKIIIKLHELEPTMIAPQISLILNMEDIKQHEFYNFICQNISKSTLSPLTLLYTHSHYPIFAINFTDLTTSFEERKFKLLETMNAVMGHQTEEATDIRFVVLYFSILSEHLKLQKEHVDMICKYPYLNHSNEEMKIIRPFIRASEMMIINIERPNNNYLEYFWKEISQMTDCTLYYIDFGTEITDTRVYMEQLYEIYSYLTELLITANPIDEKMQVILGIATYSYKRFKELIDYNLYNAIVGRSIIRILIENYIMIKFLLKHECENKNIWEEYKDYGLGLYKLVALKHREKDKVNEKCHIDYKYLDCLVNEYHIEESIDIETSYFRKQSIREKAISVGEKELFGLYYDYDSSFEHGLWGAIRESTMIKCNNPAHKYHCIPDIDNKQKLKSVLYDCIMVMNKTIEIINNIYGIPKQLYKEVTEFGK